MSFLKKLFGQSKEKPTPYADFWNWFQNHQSEFFSAVESRDKEKMSESFFNRLSPKLDEITDGLFFLAGMIDDNTAELIITVDGNVKKIVFAEELVAAAPEIPGWSFTALKQSLNMEDFNIGMNDVVYNSGNIHFYSIDDATYPDEITIMLVHDDCTEENKGDIANGSCIFLDHVLGELNFVSAIDDLTAITKEEATKELVPINKLKDFINWREKEFVEKYSGTRHNTENDNYSTMESKLESGNVLFAVLNIDLLQWDAKPSHPWMLNFVFNYDGSRTNEMPDKKTLQFFYEIEEEIAAQLKDADGYLNIVRQTGKNIRETYYACKDFRLPSKILSEITKKHKGKADIEFSIYKDKYWKSLEYFRKHLNGD
jgi:hypothetical protein